MVNKKFLWVMLAGLLTFGFVLAGCENAVTKDDLDDLATKGDIYGLYSSGSSDSLESQLEAGLKGNGLTVSVSGNDYTVTNEGGVTASLRYFQYISGPGYTAIAQNITVSNSDGELTNYYVELKFKNGDAGYDVANGNSYLTANATLTAAKKMDFDYQVFKVENSVRTTVVKSGTITLKAAPTEAGIAKYIAVQFENQLQNLSDFITDVWTTKTAASWGQTDARYTFTVVRPGSSDNINLPSTIYGGTITWGTTTGTVPAGFTFTNTTGEIAITNSLAAGTVTIPFTLTSSLVSSKYIKGNLVITTKTAY